MLSFKQLMERVNETRSFYLEEEFEELDEDLYKDQHPGYNDKHAAHSKAKSLHSSGHLKPEYHKDGSATIHVKPYNDVSSTRITDGIHQDAGLYYNHSRRKFAKGITQVHNGLKYRTRSDDGGKTHSVHISSTTEKNMRDGSAREVKEEIEGLDEISQRLAVKAVSKRGADVYGDAIDRGDVADPHQEKKFTSGMRRVKKKFGAGAAEKVNRKVGDEIGYYEEFDFDLFESIMLDEGDLSIRTLYNKYADHALGAGDKPEPKKAAAVKKAIVKVHGATVMGHLEKAKNAAAKNDQDSESTHFNNARNSAKTDTMSATVGKNRSSMRTEEVDLDEGRMKDLAMDMESLSHADFKRKHRKTKQEMQNSLKSESISLDELSRETVRTYYNKSIAQGKPIADKMKMGGGDHSSDGSDTKTLKKRAAGVTMALKRRRGEVKMSEDAEQTDEELKGNQHKIDANKNGKVDGHDFKILRNAKKARYQ